jgi:hypothetical protein
MGSVKLRVTVKYACVILRIMHTLQRDKLDLPLGRMPSQRGQQPTKRCSALATTVWYIGLAGGCDDRFK